MNILYIGEGGEAGAKLVNMLSLKNTVTAVFAEKSVYEIECEVFYRDSDICWLVREKEIEAIIYLEPRGARVDEVEKLARCAAENKGCRLVYIKEQPFFRRRAQKADAAGLMCGGLAKNYGVNTLYVRTSCLYSENLIPEYLENITAQIERSRRLTPGGAADEYCDCLHTDDFCAAVESVIGSEAQNGFDTVELQSAYPFRLSAFIDGVAKRYSQACVEDYEESFEERGCEGYKSNDWSPEHSFISDLPSLLDELEENRSDLRKNRRNLALNAALKIGTVTAAFALEEMYTQFISVSSDLQFVDMRLILVVAASLMFGKRYGFLAALFCGTASIIQSLAGGYRWYVLFYNVDNWIPIAVYFIAAILLGIYREKMISRGRK